MLPTGTVTFLLTDVEGSSRRWEDGPEAMAAAIARHYDLLDEAIAGHGGVRPVEQGEGDSVVGAFSRASDAMRRRPRRPAGFPAEKWPRGRRCGCAWPCTPGRRSCATRATTLARPSSAAPGCGPSATAARCWSLSPPPPWWLGNLPARRSCSIWACTA